MLGRGKRKRLGEEAQLRNLTQRMKILASQRSSRMQACAVFVSFVTAPEASPTTNASVPSELWDHVKDLAFAKAVTAAAGEDADAANAEAHVKVSSGVVNLPMMPHNPRNVGLSPFGPGALH